MGYIDTDSVHNDVNVMNAEQDIMKLKMNSLYGKIITLKESEYYTAMLEAYFYTQLIEEACNGNYESNHFRENMTVADCVMSFEASDMWKRYALQYCV